MKNWIIKIRIFLWLMLAGIVCWLLYMAIAPSGKISYVYNFSKPNYFIGKLTPEERVALIYDGNQKIIGDPVYFSLRTPRRFNKARLILKYRRDKDTECPIGHSVSGCIPIIETGILADKTIWRYDLQPIENKIIDDLALAWDVIGGNGIMLLQREKKYNSIDEFLNNLPGRNEIALYNYSLQKEFLLEDYALINNVGTQNFVSLRGSYQFWTYIKDEDLDFNFVFQDLNQNKDSDPIDLHLYYNDQLIDSRHLDDETSPPTDAKALAGKPAPLLNRRGEIEREGITGDERSLELRLANLPEGVYKIELRVNDDIITKSIIAKQQKMAFINKLWLADSGGSDINLWTDSKLINAQTINPSSLQAIKITSSALAPSAAAALGAESELKIEQTYKQFSVAVSSSTTKLTLEKDDVILSGNGVFSFSQDSLINPNFKKVDSYLDIDNDGINYILAEYDLPAEEDDWKIAFAEFDLTKAYRENGKYSFLISAHGFKADDDIDDYIEIDEIIMELAGKSLREKISEFLH